MRTPALLVLLAGAVFIRPANAQNPELQQHVADIQQAMAKNKQALVRYTRNEQVTISLKGEEKRQEHFQVLLATLMRECERASAASSSHG